MGRLRGKSKLFGCLLVCLFVCLLVWLSAAFVLSACSLNGDYGYLRVSVDKSEFIYGQPVVLIVESSFGYKPYCVNNQDWEIDYDSKAKTMSLVPLVEGEIELQFWHNISSDYSFYSNKVTVNIKREEKNVTNAAELMAAGNDLYKYVLQNDIDMANVTDFTPKPFNGALDGNGYKIKNFTYLPQSLATDKNMGFWSENNGIIENVSFENADMGIFSAAASAGIAVGLNNGTMNNVTVSGKIEAEQTDKVGGVVGSNVGKIDKCTNTALVKGKDLTGGIAGESVSAISGSINEGIIAGASKVGGIVGSVTDNAIVYGSVNKGSVTGSTFAGGIAGFTAEDKSVNVNGSSNSGDVKAYSYAGGIIGKGAKAVTFACSNSGRVVADGQYAGGIGGSMYSARRCVNTGAVSAEGKDVAAVSGIKAVYAGGIAGYLKRIEECVNEQRIEFTADGAYLGGIVGYLDGDNITPVMNNNINSGNVTATVNANYVGGIAGYIKNAALRGAENTGNVAGGYYAGGIFGYAESGGLYFSTNSGSITGKTAYGFGMIKSSDAVVVFECVNNGTVGGRD